MNLHRAVCRTAGRGSLRECGPVSGDAWLARWRRERRTARGAASLATPRSGQRTPRLARVEAALFVSDRPQSARRLAHFAALVDAADVLAAVTELNAAYDADGSAFRIEHVATGFRLFTRPPYAPWLEKLHERQARLRLSPPAMETLAIVAYRQPLTRADVEAVRGVQSGEMLKLLMERELVRIVGEHESLGRPYLYGTTRQFLELFGLHSLADLPQAEGLARPQPIDAPDAESDAESPDNAAA